MNWITGLIKKTSVKSTQKDIPENLWVKCPECSSLTFRKDLVKNNQICPTCDYHFLLPVKARFNLLFDNHNYINVPLPKVKEDPLKFKGKDKYIDKLRIYQEKSPYPDALITAYGKINEVTTVLSIMDFTFMGGSMGTALGEGFVKSVDVAIAKKAPFVIVTASGGARMQEGMLSLMQMAKTTIAINKLKQAKLPYVVLLTSPTTGGVTASFAMLGDIQIAEKGATIGFAGARVIEQTMRKKLPEGFQTAEYLLEHGMLDIVVHRNDLKTKLGTILDLLMNKGQEVA